MNRLKSREYKMMLAMEISIKIVESREYKIMLDATQFVGNEQQVLAKAGEFWQDFKKAIKPFVFDTDGDLEIDEEKRRIIRFYDTKDHMLRDNSYIFRVRESMSNGEREATLKFRHPDRYISQDRDMTNALDEKQDIKFEEDIKYPFASRYSFSSKVVIPEDLELKSVGDIADLYKDLENHVDETILEKSIEIVNGLNAREIVLNGADFQITEDEDVKDTKVALILWYGDENCDPEKPLVVEFSFNYEDNDENYPLDMSQRAYNIFNSIPDKLTSWTGPEPACKPESECVPEAKTKTKFAYSFSGCAD